MRTESKNPYPYSAASVLHSEQHENLRARKTLSAAAKRCSRSLRPLSSRWFGRSAAAWSPGTSGSRLRSVPARDFIHEIIGTSPLRRLPRTLLVCSLGLVWWTPTTEASLLAEPCSTTRPTFVPGPAELALTLIPGLARRWPSRKPGLAIESASAPWSAFSGRTIASTIRKCRALSAFRTLALLVERTALRLVAVERPACRTR